MPQGIVPKTVPANPVSKASDQAPMVKTPDNPEFGDTAAVINDALKAMGAEPNVSKQPATVPLIVEAKPETTTEPATPTGPTAKGWAAIKNAETKLRQERERFSEERKATTHAAQQARAEADKILAEARQQAVDIKSAFSKDPFGVLKNQFGVTLNDLAQLALSDQTTLPQARPSEDPEKKALMERLDRLEKKDQQAQQENQLNAYKAGIKRALASEDFSILETMPNAEQEIIEVAAGYARKTGEVLQPDKAAAILKKYWEQHLSKVGSHAAARRVLGLPDPVASGANGNPAPRPKGPKKTLTNQLSSPSPAVPQRLPDNLSEEEELRRAAELIPEGAWDRMT